MATEKVRTGLQLEVFTLGQVAKKLEGIEPAMKFRILNLLMAEASEAEQAKADARQTDLFDE